MAKNKYYEAKDKTFKSNNKKVVDYYDKSQKLIYDKSKLDADYLLSKIDRDVYVKKAKRLNDKKDKLVKEIIAYRDRNK